MFKKDDIVYTKSWDELKTQFVPDSCGDSGWEDTEGRFFPAQMRNFCGRKAIIRFVNTKYNAYVLSNGYTWHKNWLCLADKGE